MNPSTHAPTSILKSGSPPKDMFISSLFALQINMVNSANKNMSDTYVPQMDASGSGENTVYFNPFTLYNIDSDSSTPSTFFTLSKFNQMLSISNPSSINANKSLCGAINDRIIEQNIKTTIDILFKIKGTLNNLSGTKSYIIHRAKLVKGWEIVINPSLKDDRDNVDKATQLLNQIPKEIRNSNTAKTKCTAGPAADPAPAANHTTNHTTNPAANPAAANPAAANPAAANPAAANPAAANPAANHTAAAPAGPGPIWDAFIKTQSQSDSNPTQSNQWTIGKDDSNLSKIICNNNNNSCYNNNNNIGDKLEKELERLETITNTKIIVFKYINNSKMSVRIAPSTTVPTDCLFVLQVDNKYYQLLFNKNLQAPANTIPVYMANYLAHYLKSSVPLQQGGKNVTFADNSSVSGNVISNNLFRPLLAFKLTINLTLWHADYSPTEKEMQDIICADSKAKLTEAWNDLINGEP